MEDTGTEDGVFRETRAGVPFSPWHSSLGVPLHAPADFLLHRRIRVALKTQYERLAALATDPGADPDDPTVTTPGSHLSTALAPTTDSCLPSADTSADAPPVLDVTEYDDAVSKAQFHRRKHKKDTRRRKRAAKQAPDMNRPMKSGAATAPVGIVIPPTECVAPPPPAYGQSAAPTSATVAASYSDGDPPPGLSKPIVSPMSLDMQDQPRVAKSAFVGILTEPTEAELAARSKDDFEALGFEYHEWDGREDFVILDHTGTYIVAAFSSEPAWDHEQLNKELQAEFQKANERYHFPAEPNRRGDDVRAIPVGVSFGGGQVVVGNLVHGSKHNEAVVQDLVNVPAVKRIANFGNASLQRFGPKLYKCYDSVLTDLCARDPSLKRTWTNNVFACATFNVGPRTVTVKHTDHLNIAYGLCSITPVGNYNPKRGGQIVLWELRMVIEFPPLCSALIPSAIVSHSNIDIEEGETRYSLTQYSAGGLFRWVAAGFRTLKSLRAQGGHLPESGEEHWKRGIGLLSTWEELLTMWRSVV